MEHLLCANSGAGTGNAAACEAGVASTFLSPAV